MENEVVAPDTPEAPTPEAPLLYVAFRLPVVLGDSTKTGSWYEMP